jgi:large subunit ribosomal protein L4
MPEAKSKVLDKGQSSSGRKTQKLKVESKPKETKAAILSVPVFDLAGKESGLLELPKELFGVEVNSQLLAQALRVYLNNQKAHFSSTKTRGEVAGSTRKVRAQKGTGGARHGGIRAPIFVGGGIALGPKFRKIVLDLPKKMKQAALKSALSSKLKAGEIMGVTGLDKASGKTKEVQKFLDTISKNDVLLVVDSKSDGISRATRNLPKVEVSSFDQINALKVVSHRTLMLTKETVEKLQARATKEEIK